MKEQLIEFKTAAIAKKKGFDVHTLDFYMTRDGSIGEFLDVNPENHNQFPDVVSAPTQSLLQKWLRETKKIEVFVKPFIYEQKIADETYSCWVYNSRGEFEADEVDFESWEDALEAGLKEALKSIEIPSNEKK